jgi:hypothetical protein
MIVKPAKVDVRLMFTTGPTPLPVMVVTAGPFALETLIDDPSALRSE